MSNTDIDIVVMSQDAARKLTDQIKADAEKVWDLITRAYTERAWEALNYPSWDDYCSNEFGSTRLRLPREEREAVVASLRDQGLSIRAIASAAGIDAKTVQTDLKSAVGISHTSEPLDVEEVAPVVGLDGKKHPRRKAPAKKAPAKKAPAKKAPAKGGHTVGEWLGLVGSDIKGLEKKLDEVFSACTFTGPLPKLPAGMGDTLLRFSDQLDRINQTVEKIESARESRKGKSA